MLASKIHNYKLTITIHQIRISVKFPCSVSVGLKSKTSDPKSVPTSEFKLEKGLAIVNHQLTTDISLKYNPKVLTYGGEQKVNLTVYLKSSSGKIPAGSSTFTIKSSKQVDHQSIGIEKCPDRNAKIEYSLKMKFINEEDCLDESVVSRASVQYPVVNSITQCRTPSVRQYRQNRQNRQYAESVKKNAQKSDLFSSRVSSQALNRNFFGDDRSEKSQTGSQSRISRIIMRQHEMETSSQRQKILELQRQKSKHMKQIRNLKNQLQTNSLRNSNVSSPEDQYLTQKRQSRIIVLEDQVDREKNKASEYRTELHKYKLKMQEVERQLQSSKKKYKELQQQLKVSSEENETFRQKNKELNIQLRQLKQKYEDNVLMYQNSSKRSQFKQNVYKQQIKTLNEKYGAAEAQKQKLLFQKNQILNDIERKELKDKENLRQKERQHQEQKLKYNKRIDSLEKQLLAKKEEKENVEQNMLELQLEHHRLKLQNQENGTIILELNQEISSLQDQLSRQRISKKTSQSKLHDNQRYTQEIQTLKQRVRQKQLQSHQKSKTIGSLQANKKILNKKIEEMEAGLWEKQSAITKLERDIDNLNKKLSNMNRRLQEEQDITFMSDQNEEDNVPHFAGSVAGDRDRNRRGLNKNMQKINSSKEKQLKQENQELCEQNFILENNLASVSQAYNKLKAEYGEMKAEYVELAEKHQGLELEQDQLKAVKMQNEELSQQIDSVLAIKTEIEEGYARQLEQLRSKYDEAVSKRQQKGAENSQINKMSQLLKERDEEIRKLKVELAHAEDHFKIVQETTEYQTEEINQYQTQLDKLQQKYKKLEETLSHHQVNSQQTNFIQAINHLLPQLYQSPEPSQSAILLQFQHYIAQCQQSFKFQSSQPHKSQPQQTITQLSKNIQDKESQIEKYNETIDKLQGDNLYLKERIRELEEKCDQYDMRSVEDGNQILALKNQLETVNLLLDQKMGVLGDSIVKQPINSKSHIQQPTKSKGNIQQPLNTKGHIQRQFIQMISEQLKGKNNRQILLKNMQEGQTQLYQLLMKKTPPQLRQLNKQLQKLKLQVITTLNKLKPKSPSQQKAILQQFRKFQIMVDQISK